MLTVLFITSLLTLIVAFLVLSGVGHLHLRTTALQAQVAETFHETQFQSRVTRKALLDEFAKVLPLVGYQEKPSDFEQVMQAIREGREPDSLQSIRSGMKFSRDERQLSITVSFDDGEKVDGSVIDALVAQAESSKFWEVRAIVAVRYRYLDCFDEFYEEANDGATVTLRKSVSIRPRIKN